MQFIRTGPCHERKLPSWITSIFSGIRRTLDSKLLQCIYRDQSVRSSKRSGCWEGPSNSGGDPNRIDTDVGAHAVDRIIVRFRALTIHTEFARGANRCSACLRASRHHTRREQDEILEAAPVQRHVLDIFAVYHGAHRRVLSIYQRCAAGDCDRLRGRP